MKAIKELEKVIEVPDAHGRKEAFKDWTKKWFMEGSMEHIVSAQELAAYQGDRAEYLRQLGEGLIRALLGGLPGVPGALAVAVAPTPEGVSYRALVGVLRAEPWEDAPVEPEPLVRPVGGGLKLVR